jgi:hypothetical protein
MIVPPLPTFVVPPSGGPPQPFRLKAALRTRLLTSRSRHSFPYQAANDILALDLLCGPLCLCGELLFFYWPQSPVILDRINKIYQDLQDSIRAIRVIRS